jgi:hypothetical protein
MQIMVNDNDSHLFLIKSIAYDSSARVEWVVTPFYSFLKKIKKNIYWVEATKQASQPVHFHTLYSAWAK